MLELKDYFFSQEAFFLIKNSDYGFLETHPQPECVNKYYESESYISHTDSKKDLFAQLYQFVKTFNIRSKFSMLTNPEQGAKLLDYGCGVGDFLLYSKNNNLDVLGVEPNLNARQAALEKVGKDLILDIELKNIAETFDIITLWHVLEHIPNLCRFIEDLKNHLNPGGEILIAVPNYLSLDAKFYKQYWAAYDVPRHLWHFSPQSMQQLFESFGMKIEKKYPLWFDSFYVSLLSEKYKKTRLGFLRAFGIAFISNLSGMFSGNYSSVVYKIRKNKQ